MIIFKSINTLNKEVNFKARIGFVPTMGSLHKGHISLIKSSKKKCSKTLVSIFINPSQFNKTIDLKNYPKNLKKDIAILKKMKVDYVLVPKLNEIYQSKKDMKINLKKKDKIMCAKFRPGHFEGVLAVINQFLKKIKVSCIFLGAKDYQQFYLIYNFIKKKFSIKIFLCKTIRDKNKVALSSRNVLLKKKDLYKSSIISKLLIKLKNNAKNSLKLNNEIKKIKVKIKNLENVKIEYLEIRNKNNLSKSYTMKNFKIFLAYYINNVRLIDNY